MPRPALVLPILLLAAPLTSACADDSTAMTGSGTTDTTSDTTVGSTTGTSAPTTTTMGPTSSPTSSPTSATAPTTLTTTSDTSDTSTTSTTDTTDTTGGGVCGVDGDSVSAELVHDDAPGGCAPLEFTGVRVSPEKGPQWELDACPCGVTCLVPDPWSLSVSAPAPWLPLIPECPRIVVERAMTFSGCEFLAMSVWDLEAPGEPAVYHAGHGFSPTQPALGELTVTAHAVDTCECVGCCDTAELWDLQLELGGDSVTLSEGATGTLGGRDAINFESHRSGICDAPLDVHWVLRRPA